ncbi:MAG: SoxR reducing system RseC family protein [Rikenellaceae bacterium]|nr:SoxR reducing system RseC family protein [Rikenellaceae bacterium]
MKNDITHKGLIFDIVGNRIDVSVTPDNACAGCKAAAICTISETADKVVSVISDHPEYFEIGEEVIVSVGRGMGVRAVILAYVIPFLVLLFTLIGLLSADVSEPTAGLISLGAIAMYYSVLYFFRNRIERELIFKINKIDD